MSLQKPDIKLLELAKKWLTGTISSAERAEFDHWYDNFDDSRHELNKDITEEALEQRMHQAIFRKAGLLPQHKAVRLWPRIVAAASFFILFAAGTWFIVKRNASQDDHHLEANWIKPGKNKAFLTLGNGKRISLNDIHTGNIAEQDGVQVSKSANGQIIYRVGESGSTASSVYNTIETPRGGQYQLILPDGSRVWLNAASSLRFPASFADQQKRKVILSGEAYFEVAKDKLHPFQVETARQTVEVLGTIFNISSYAEEPAVRTTLLEGSVQVSNLYSHTSAILKPGQQSIVSGSELTTRPVETEDEVAWKNGSFMFNHESLEDIMNEVSRWYNVDIVFRDNQLRNKQFFGSVNRYANLADLLRILEQTGVAEFEIRGRQLIVFTKK